jgi:aspartyl-tRNA(Asn)/glutamyl-tRNA(Gln) amidotransferase subunit C
MITKNQIEHLAKLARLKLSEVEVENLSKDLTEILTYVEKINEINLENVEPLTNILEKLDLREDNHRLTDNSLIIENFPEKEDDYLKVPKILEKE